MTRATIPAVFSFMALLGAVEYAVAQTPINVGIANSATDVGVFIADKRGYFKREGLDVTLSPFNAGAQMIAPFASGDLDVGAAGPAAALYNASARGIDIRIVADKGSTPPGRPISYLLVRKDHVDSGRYKTLADLKGMKIANSAQGASANTVLTKLLKKAGLSFDDVERVYLGFPQQALALQNGAVDAAVPVEPAASAAVKSGAVVRVAGDDTIYPNHQIATIFYSGQFIAKKPDAARTFMRAYLQGVRDYNDGIVDGKLVGEKGEAIIDILTQYSTIKEAAIYRSISAANIDPDGKVNVDSLTEDLSIFASEGLIEGKVDMAKVVDMSFVDAAVKAMGSYARK
jgi:NitT/TauT family transport system substrate-binding protein